MKLNISTRQNASQTLTIKSKYRQKEIEAQPLIVKIIMKSPAKKAEEKYNSKIC